MSAVTKQTTKQLPLAGVPVKVTRKPKLRFRMITADFYRYSYLGGAVEVEVRKNLSPKFPEILGKWGIIMGWRDYSRDKGKFYETKEEAMVHAEKLLELICLRVFEDMGLDVEKLKKYQEGR